MTLIVFNKHQQSFKYFCSLPLSAVITTRMKLQWSFFKTHLLCALVFSFFLLLHAYKGPSLHISCWLDWKTLHQLMTFVAFYKILKNIYQALSCFLWLFLENDLVWYLVNTVAAPFIFGRFPQNYVESLQFYAVGFIAILGLRSSRRRRKQGQILKYWKKIIFISISLKNNNIFLNSWNLSSTSWFADKKKEVIFSFVTLLLLFFR